MEVGRALIAATLVMAGACSPGARLSRVELGEQVTTGRGNVVTVYGWTRPSSGSQTADPMSGLDLRSCRTRRDGLLLDAGGFTVQTVRGTVLVGNGSRFTADGSDCVRGQILFDVPAGEAAEFAQYRTGRKLLRWNLSAGAAADLEVAASSRRLGHQGRISSRFQVARVPVASIVSPVAGGERLRCAPWGRHPFAVLALACLVPLASAGGMSSPASALVVATASVSDASPEFFSSEPNRTWGTSPSEDPEEWRDKAGKVVALVEAGDKIFLGGEFAGVMPPGISTSAARKDPGPVVRLPYLAALDVRSGVLLDWDAQPDGPVLSLAVSADRKRLYVGGSFSHIGGKAIRRLAAVDLDTGRWDPTFNPPIPNAYVKAMALSGDRLYIGGAFTQLGTHDRPQLAALDAATGTLVEDWVPPPNTGGRFVGQTGIPTKGTDPGNVADLKVTADGTMVVIAGSFLNFGGRSGLIVLDAHSGHATPWQPELDPPRPVLGLDIWPGDGSTFFAAAGGRGGAVAAFTPGRSTKPLWVHRVDGDGTDIAASRQRVYFVGHFDYVLGKETACSARSCTGGNPGDAPNRHIAAFDPRNGNHDTTFTAQFNTPQGPEVAMIGAHHLYVGGDFTKVNFDPHPGFAQFSATHSPPST